MESVFDNLQNTVFNVTTQVMGYDAEWAGGVGGALLYARVHFNNPTESLRLAAVEYDAEAAEIEYKDGDFPGLKEKVDIRNSQETVTVGGTIFYVLSVVKKHDGKTFLAKVRKANI